MADYKLLDYDNGNAVLDASVTYTNSEIHGGEKIIHSGMTYKVREIEHDPGNSIANLYLTQKSY